MQEIEQRKFSMAVVHCCSFQTKDDRVFGTFPLNCISLRECLPKEMFLDLNRKKVPDFRTFSRLLQNLGAKCEEVLYLL